MPCHLLLRLRRQLGTTPRSSWAPTDPNIRSPIFDPAKVETGEPLLLVADIQTSLE